MKKTFLIIATTIMATALFAQDIKLPAPQKTGGMPMMEAFNNRKTDRDFNASKDVDLQTLSNLLWAATGVNRADGKMTAPTASNNQQVVIFVGLKKGVYEYLPKTHTLKLHLNGDHRAVFGRQAFAATVPVTLAFMSDYNKMEKYDEKAKWKYSCTDIGNVSQNVYLFCASVGLKTVVLGNFDGDLLKKTLKLGDNYMPILDQLVGW